MPERSDAPRRPAGKGAGNVVFLRPPPTSRLEEGATADSLTDLAETFRRSSLALERCAAGLEQAIARIEGLPPGAGEPPAIVAEEAARIAVLGLEAARIAAMMRRGDLAGCARLRDQLEASARALDPREADRRGS